MMETKKERLVLRRQIGKQEERSYLEVLSRWRARWSASTSRTVMNAEARPGTVVDIGLRSPERIVGWSGGAREAFFVGTEKATPGYLAGPIAEGEWAVLLGAYKIPEGGAEVIVEVEFARPHGRWMKGDLHMHSVHSDGSYTMEQAKDSCKARGLEFMALTDHNTASQNFAALAPDELLLLIPGVELTSYFGHANVLGVPEALRDFRVTTPEQADEVLGEVRERGGFVSLNHPFCPSCPWELGFDVPYDAIEVWNGPWRALNERALAWWQEQLAQGRRIIALGGSDAHREDRFVKHGRPTASVWTEADTVQGVLTGIRQGRVVLQFDPDETCMALSLGRVRDRRYDSAACRRAAGRRAADHRHLRRQGRPRRVMVRPRHRSRVGHCRSGGRRGSGRLGDGSRGSGGWTVQREIAAILAFDAREDKGGVPAIPAGASAESGVAPQQVGDGERSGSPALPRLRGPAVLPTGGAPRRGRAEAVRHDLHDESRLHRTGLGCAIRNANRPDQRPIGREPSRLPHPIRLHASGCMFAAAPACIQAVSPAIGRGTAFLP